MAVSLICLRNKTLFGWRNGSRTTHAFLSILHVIGGIAVETQGRRVGLLARGAGLLFDQIQGIVLIKGVLASPFRALIGVHFGGILVDASHEGKSTAIGGHLPL